jgi:cell division protease FtsH
LIDEIVVLLGGRVAEQLVFNEIATGAQNDLERATEIARRMICEFGMSDRLGPLTLGRRHGPIFLGRDIAEDRNYSEEVAAKIDQEIRQIIDQCYERATELISANRDKLDRIVVRLLEKETIDAEELTALMSDEGGALAEPAPPPPMTPPSSGLTTPPPSDRRETKPVRQPPVQSPMPA